VASTWTFFAAISRQPSSRKYTKEAGALRFYQLGVVPPGPQFDEAFNALDAELVMAGNRPLFLPANGGREVVYTYIQAAVGALFGLNVYTLRLVSAVVGTLTVVALYFTVRGLFRRNGRWLAATTALALAVSYWHIHFSHYGIRVILMPLLLCGVFGLFWLGMHGASARMRLLAMIGSGLLAGLSVWTNPTGRFTPFVVGAYVVWLLWRYPERRRLTWDSPLVGGLLFSSVAFVVFLPKTFLICLSLVVRLRDANIP
jgi:dolichyl-phosphate-mannose--protein O-mannosyl transferase